MNLKALGSPERIEEEEAPPKQSMEDEAPLIMAEEAQPIPKKLAPLNVMTGVLSKLAP